MASISISHPFPSQDNNDHNSPFSYPFASEQDGSAAGATFIVNPASSHPPSSSISLKTRTPRTSIINSSVDEEKFARISIYETTAYGEEAETQVTEIVPSAPSR